MIRSPDFVAKARKIHDARYGYIWGAKGQIASMALLKACIAEAKRSGRYVFTQAKIDFAKKLIEEGRYVTDCSGFLTEAAGQPVISSAQIWSECVDKIDLPAKNPEAVIPQIAGLIVYRPGHIGMFLGDGWVVEAGGYSKGVIYTKLSEPATGKAWTGCGKWTRIKYVSPEKIEKPEAKAPTGAIGVIVNCKNFCNRRALPKEKSLLVGKADAGQEVAINGKHMTDGVVWYHDSAGNWIHSKFVEIEDSAVTWM